MKVFKVNDYEWWAGQDVESVKAACEAAWGEAEWDDFYPEEMTDREMDREHTDDDGNLTSLREMLRAAQARGAEFPGFLAASE